MDASAREVHETDARETDARATRALVTGVGGFTGSRLALGLVRRGYAVRGLARRAPASDDARALAAAGVEVMVGDIRDAAAVTRAVEGVSVVFNIAAIFRRAGVYASEYRAVNAEAVGALIEAAARAGATRVVHCSTVGVHGHIEHPPATEDAPFRPGDIYQRTKLEGEQVAREAAARTGMAVTIVRPSPIYGPGDLRLLKLFRAIAKRRFAMLGAGQVRFHMTYIDDLVDGIIRSGETPAAAGRTYILAGPEAPQLNALMRIIAAEVGAPPPRLHLPVWPVWLAGALCEGLFIPFKLEPPLYRRRVAFFTNNRWFDCSRAAAELGYVPRISVVEGVRRTAAWYREKGLLA